ncbi:protein FAR1-RELATED SEQUENCE 5-like [Cornus florida]|uniref:protein FAR1-RELATED SEQUENCE 5-like n=1 Tax=Cornus florida TaxID=4283 RepID=UPI0028969A99|nr:protein FAR1-RELATED SEQUENCE 5-like [Cornus florida]
MMFKSVENAYDFYNTYGREVGFSVKMDYSNKNYKIGEITSAQFVCCKEGYRENDKKDHLTKEVRAETRVVCGAFMHVKFEREEEIYFVDRFEKKHYHKLIRKDCTHLMPSQWNISVSQAVDIGLADDSGLPVGSSYELMGRQSRMLENPSFFHAIQLDKDDLITNIFWTNARMIIDYGHFGDIVSFDTTYKVNNVNRPFAAFVGLNHHRETVMFGGALMYDETADSFMWLFETFFKAMSRKFLKTIISDQDATITKALTLVMPETHYHLCIWHIMQNGTKHLGNVITGPRVKIFFNLSIIQGEHLLKLLEEMRRQKRVQRNNEYSSKVDNGHQIHVTYELSGHDITGAEILSEYAWMSIPPSPPPSPNLQRIYDYQRLQLLNRCDKDSVTNAKILNYDLSQATTAMNIASQSSYCPFLKQVNETTNHVKDTTSANLSCD